MNINLSPTQLETINEISLNIAHDEIDRNNEELEKIKNMVEKHIQNDFKCPLLPCVFLLFYNAGKTTLKKSELYSLMEQEIMKYKNKIISAPTERYILISKNNYKSRIKDILKRKKWFIRNVTDSKEKEFTLKPNSVPSVTPKIITYLKILEKNHFFFSIEIKEDEKTVDNEKEVPNKPNDEKMEIIDISDISDINEIPKDESNNDEKNIKEEIVPNIINNKIQEIYVKNEKNEENIDNIKEKNSPKETENGEKIKIKEDYDIIIDEEDGYYLNESMIDFPEKNKDLFNDKDLEIENINNKTIELGEQFLKKKRRHTKVKCNNKKARKKKKQKKIIKKQLESSFISLDIDDDDFLKEGPIQDSKINEEKKSLESTDNSDLLTNTNNKIKSIINIGNSFLSILNSYNFSELSSNKIISIKEDITQKEKEIESNRKLIEKIAKIFGNINSINKKKAKERINRLKKNYKNFQEQFKILSKYKQMIDNNSSENKDMSDINKNYNENFKKCSEIYEKMLIDLPLFYKDCTNLIEMINVLFSKKVKDDNFSLIHKLIDFGDYRNAFKNILNKVMINNNNNDNNYINLGENDLKNEFNDPKICQEKIRKKSKVNQMQNIH